MNWCYYRLKEKCIMNSGDYQSSNRIKFWNQNGCKHLARYTLYVIYSLLGTCVIIWNIWHQDWKSIKSGFDSKQTKNVSLCQQIFISDCCEDRCETYVMQQFYLTLGTHGIWIFNKCLSKHKHFSYVKNCHENLMTMLYLPNTYWVPNYISLGHLANR